MLVARSIVKQGGRKVDRPTKNRRLRLVAIDQRTSDVLLRRLELLAKHAEAAGVAIAEDPYLFACDTKGLDPWDPDTITPFFGPLRKRLDLDHLEFKGLRRFMDTYGQEMGFSLALVAMRAGHDPAVAGKHYTGESSRPIVIWPMRLAH